MRSLKFLLIYTVILTAGSTALIINGLLAWAGVVEFQLANAALFLFGVAIPGFFARANFKVVHRDVDTNTDSATHHG